MRISDWSSDVCSSDLPAVAAGSPAAPRLQEKKDSVMAEITAALVKELRESSDAGMVDCKKALTETGGDLEAGVHWLRPKGRAAAAKEAGRVAAEGLVGVAVEGSRGPGVRSAARSVGQEWVSAWRSGW